MSTGQEDCPGNNGLKDQTMVLRWIQENIGAFGGDKNKVSDAVECNILRQTNPLLSLLGNNIR